jgi:LPXTG-site transpeptidase (sortase) family protein
VKKKSKAVKSKPSSSKYTLSLWNKLLSALNILVALYILIIPFIPALELWLKQRTGNQAPPFSGKLAAQAGKPTDRKPQDNRLVIPSILINERIYEGATTQTLSKGVWRWPDGKNPSLVGNTVLAGHVFAYQSPSVFYNLHKVKPGERIAIYWEGVEYLYRVREKEVVKPSQTDALKPSDKPTLTIYTCSPPLNPVNRLVLISDLEDITKL